MSAKYATIGINYAELRRPDRWIAAAIREALGSAKTTLNVGAGTGSYEPADRQVTAVEPSLEMIRKRNSSVGRVIQTSAENLPFDDNAFEASMAILTVHHVLTDFADSYLGRLRSLVGPRLLLVPGARVVIENEAGEILLQNGAISEFGGFREATRRQAKISRRLPFGKYAKKRAYP